MVKTDYHVRLDLTDIIVPLIQIWKFDIHENYLDMDKMITGFLSELSREDLYGNSLEQTICDVIAVIGEDTDMEMKDYMAYNDDFSGFNPATDRLYQIAEAGLSLDEEAFYISLFGLIANYLKQIPIFGPNSDFNIIYSSRLFARCPVEIFEYKLDVNGSIPNAYQPKPISAIQNHYRCGFPHFQL